MAVDVAPRGSAFDARWLAVPAALFAAALGVAAVVSPVAAVVGVAAMIFVTVAFHDLAAGVALFTALTFLTEAPGADGVVKIAGLVLVLAALRRSGTPLLLKEHPAVAYATAFFAVWALASSLWAEDSSRAVGDGLRLVLDVALVFVVFAAVRQARDVRWILWGYIAGAAAAAVAGLVVPSYDVEDRVGGTLGNPNLLAAMLVPALVFSLFAFAWTASSARRLLLAACSVLFAVTIVLTQSRGGLVALAAALVAALVFGGSIRRFLALVTVVVASAGFAYYAAFASSESLERVLQPGGGTGRTDLWSVATEVIADHPVLGVGAGNFPVVAPQYATETVNLPYVHLIVDTPKATHNAYLGVFADLGIIGLLSFALILVTALVLVRRSTKAFATARERGLEFMSRALFVGLVALLTHFIFLSGQYEKQFWLVLGLTFAMYALARRQHPRSTRPGRALASGR